MNPSALAPFFWLVIHQIALNHDASSFLVPSNRVPAITEILCPHITYIPMVRGFMYLFAVMDWHSRKILAWELPNTLDTNFCARTLNKA